MDAVFKIDIWDHDTISSDDLIGGATFTLRDISSRHAPNMPPLALQLRDEHGKNEGKR